MQNSTATQASETGYLTGPTPRGRNHSEFNLDTRVEDRRQSESYLSSGDYVVSYDLINKSYFHEFFIFFSI